MRAGAADLPGGCAGLRLFISYRRSCLTRNTGIVTTSSSLCGIHAGKTGDPDNLFLTKNVIALGWVAVGDLSKLPPNREGFKVRVRECYPDWKKGHFWSLFENFYLVIFAPPLHSETRSRSSRLVESPLLLSRM